MGRAIFQKAGALLLVGLLSLGAIMPVAAEENTAQQTRIEREQAKKQEQPLNNQPVWQEIRSGNPAYSAIKGRESNVLIQSEGEVWRAWRTPISALLGCMFAFAVVALLIFYSWRGSINVHGKMTGKLIRRFTPLERFAHWSMGICFVLLGLTGMIITFGKTVLLPILGYSLHSWLLVLAKNVHNFVGPVFTVFLALFALLFLRYNIPKAYDIPWIFKLGGMLDKSGKTHVPSGKFNIGEKLVYWGLVVGMSALLIITGFILDFPNFDQPRLFMQIANIVHMLAGLLAMTILCVHVYLGTFGMQGAFAAMRYGYVDETWAKEHHELWYNDVISGKVARGPAAEKETVDALVARKLA